jgi:hypothetical protein
MTRSILLLILLAGCAGAPGQSVTVTITSSCPMQGSQIVQHDHSNQAQADCTRVELMTGSGTGGTATASPPITITPPRTL